MRGRVDPKNSRNELLEIIKPPMRGAVSRIEEAENTAVPPVIHTAAIFELLP
jgi:hypothetical protein